MTAPAHPASGGEPASHVSIWKVAAASFIGTAVEWYDFFLYGTAAALIFNRLFFPSFDPLVGTLAAFATFAVGFVARPLGGVVFGHFGDKLGRKSMLSATLIIMGAATFAIGLLPTYEHIGMWAPLLLVLLRVAQGFGLGGEWGGAWMKRRRAKADPRLNTSPKRSSSAWRNKGGRSSRRWRPPACRWPSPTRPWPTTRSSTPTRPFCA